MPSSGCGCKRNVAAAARDFDPAAHRRVRYGPGHRTPAPPARTRLWLPEHPQTPYRQARKGATWLCSIMFALVLESEFTRAFPGSRS